MSRAAQSQHRKAIRRRVINTFLDFQLLEEHLDQPERDRIFDSLNANKVLSDSEQDEVEIYADPSEQVFSLSTMLAFIYRETREGTGHHPPFASLLEHAILQGENEPGATYWGNYEVTIEVEEITPETINVNAITERIQNGDIDQLTEGEMAAFLSILGNSSEFDSSMVKREYDRLVEEYEEEYGGQAPDLSWILAGGPPIFEDSNGTNEEE